ncbi:MAG: hypothetical protein P1P84_02525 [Deferrisomatales bacterium]|nr:hypothetical protein [Deferrisomatales bacterium]
MRGAWQAALCAAMNAAQARELTEEVLDMVRVDVQGRLLTAPPHWGPMHIAALVAREAIALASATQQGRAAMVDVDDGWILTMPPGPRKGP